MEEKLRQAYKGTTLEHITLLGSGNDVIAVFRGEVSGATMRLLLERLPADVGVLFCGVAGAGLRVTFVPVSQ